jgi:hypothetical protein
VAVERSNPEDTGQLRRAPGRQLDKHAVLGQGHILGQIIERSSGDGHQRPACAQDGVD